MAVEILSETKPIRIFNNDFAWLILVFNTGSAFGMKILPSLALAIVAIIAALGLAYYLWWKKDIPFLYGVPLALIMGGAIGNLIDRIRIGAVIDFLSIDMPDFLMQRFPVFNIADSAVTVGVSLLIILSLFQKSSPNPMTNPKDNTVDSLLENPVEDSSSSIEFDKSQE